MICARIETSSAETDSSAMMILGLQRQRARDRDALPLAAGEFVRIALRVLRRQPHVLEQPRDAVAAASALARRRARSSGSTIEKPTVRRGSSEAYGSWKTIWMSRRSARNRSPASCAMSRPSNSMLAAVDVDQPAAAIVRWSTCRSRIRRPAPASRPRRRSKLTCSTACTRRRTRPKMPRAHGKARREFANLQQRCSTGRAVDGARRQRTAATGAAVGSSLCASSGKLRRAHRCPASRPDAARRPAAPAYKDGAARERSASDGALFDLLAAIHHQHAVGDLGHHAHVVRDEDHAPCCISSLQHADQLAESAPGSSRRAPSSARRRSAARACTRAPWRSSRAGACRRKAGADSGQALARASGMRTSSSMRSASRARCRAVLALVQPDRFGDLLADREDRIQRRHRLLEDHRHVGAAHRAHGRSCACARSSARRRAREIDRPDVMRPPPCSTRRMSDSAVTDLPEPDSPTMASVSPRRP